MRKALCGLVFLMAIARGCYASDKPAQKVFGDGRLKVALEEVLDKIRDPRLESRSFIVSSYLPHVPPGFYAGSFCGTKTCFIYVSPSLLALFNENGLRVVLLHELGHIVYGETEASEEEKLPFDVRADLYAVVNLQKLGVNPRILIDILHVWQLIVPDISTAERIVHLEAFLNGVAAMSETLDRK